MRYYANLHLHSTHSDGVYTPTELARMAAEEGYGAAALTDHDTVSGYGEFKAECERLGLETVFAAEFSAENTISGKKPHLHIVGFGFDAEHPDMKRYIECMGISITEETRVLIQRGLDEGFISGFTWDEVLEFNKGIKWICNDHVYALMKHKGLTENMDHRTYFQALFATRRGTVPLIYPYWNVEDVIDLVHKAGGIAILAHPHNQLQYLDAFIEMGLDGIETSHFMLTDEEKAEATRLALEKNLFISGGTDHEGYLGGSYRNYKNPEEAPWYIPMCTVGASKEHFDEIKNLRLNR